MNNDVENMLIQILQENNRKITEMQETINLMRIELMSLKQGLGLTEQTPEKNDELSEGFIW